MSTYAIGDIQGCFNALCRLLEKVNYDESNDRLWFAGDLVNRGPQSLKTLRFVKGLGNRAVTVLGNHDIHLLALHYGVRERKSKDNTLIDTLEADDKNELIDWLQSRPVIHLEDNTIMVHAGIHPDWCIDTLKKIKLELETSISNVNSKQSLAALDADTNGTWVDAKNTTSRLRYALNVLTRMRYCEKNASPEYRCSEPPGNQPDHLLPWFELPDHKLQDHTIIFGHWAALGYHNHKNVYALDSGCVWGNALTALRLEDKEVFSVSCEKSS